MDVDQEAVVVDASIPITNGLPDLIAASVDEADSDRHGSSPQQNEPLASTSTSNGIAKPAKPKQKRNKPTLSCLECVERKTKCDRARPCLACVKRQSACEYSAVATSTAGSIKGRHVSKPSTRIRKPSIASSAGPVLSPAEDTPWRSHGSRGHRQSWSSTGSPQFQLSHVPYLQSSPSNVFGVGSQHPFSNYWTCQGGLPEVISVLPSKDQADILIAKYFESVDPIYPFLHRRSFYADYERFWALPPDEMNRVDASFMALHYAMYALGTQFMDFPSYDERSQTAEFYASAANQSLRLYSYLNRTSMRAIQAMLLMSYFLMNDNHASDAYAWAGIHLRQAYAMRLNRDPDIVVPDASVLEKQQRRKLWQAVFLHDTFLTILLKLPPTATHSDVPVETLADDHEMSAHGLDSCLGVQSRVENLMSINVIAPQTFEPLMPPLPHHIVAPATMQSDVAYMRSMWHLGILVQEHLSSPTSLALPLANSPRQKEALITSFKRLYKSFPAHLTTLDYTTLQQQCSSYPRAVRQNLYLTSNYYHCLMLLHAAENTAQGVECDALEALHAAHEALWSFFKLWALFEGEAGVSWVFQHRAFEDSLLVAHLLAHHPPPHADVRDHQSTHDQAKGDIQRMMDIMERYGGNLEMHKTRKDVLHEAFEKIVV